MPDETWHFFDRIIQQLFSRKKGEYVVRVHYDSVRYSGYVDAGADRFRQRCYISCGGYIVFLVSGCPRFGTGNITGHTHITHCLLSLKEACDMISSATHVRHPASANDNVREKSFLSAAGRVRWHHRRLVGDPSSLEATLASPATAALWGVGKGSFRGEFLRGRPLVYCASHRSHPPSILPCPCPRSDRALSRFLIELVILIRRVESELLRSS